MNSERPKKIALSRSGEMEIEEELIDPEVFKGDFPHLLTVNYSHLWSKQDNSIEFRRKPSGKTHFSMQTDIDYVISIFYVKC